MVLLRSLLFCIKVYYNFAKTAREVRIDNLGLSKSLREDAMQDRLEEMYEVLLDKATHLSMKDDDAIYYNILEVAYESAQRRYLKY